MSEVESASLRASESRDISQTSLNFVLQMIQMHIFPALARSVLMSTAMILTFVFCSHAMGQNNRTENRLLVEHNSRILVKEKNKAGVNLISIVADQVLFSSRAYIHVWRFETIDDIAAYLESQEKAGVVSPRNIDLSRCHHFTAGFASKFAIEGTVYQWYPGNVNASWLQVDDCDRFEVLDFKQMTKGFRPVEEGFLPWTEFIKQNSSKVYQRSWTEFAAENIEDAEGPDDRSQKKSD